MRKIELKTISIVLSGDPSQAPAPFRYADAIVGVINAHGAQRGMALTEVNQCLRILNPIEAAGRAGGTSVLLEEQDWEYLNRIVGSFDGWRLIHPVVSDFVSDIGNAARVDRAPAAAPEPPRQTRRR